MLDDTLYRRYSSADDFIKQEGCPEELADRFHEIEDTLRALWYADTARWMFRFYRDEWREWEDGDREEPPCRCGDPGCPWLNGEVPYQLRRRESDLRKETRDATKILRDYQKRHPQAVVVDEALDALTENRSSASEALSSLIRELKAAAAEDDTFRDPIEDVNLEEDLIDLGPDVPAPLEVE